MATENKTFLDKVIEENSSRLISNFSKQSLLDWIIKDEKRLMSDVVIGAVKREVKINDLNRHTMVKDLNHKPVTNYTINTK